MHDLIMRQVRSWEAWKPLHTIWIMRLMVYEPWCDVIASHLHHVAVSNTA